MLRTELDLATIRSRATNGHATPGRSAATTTRMVRSRATLPVGSDTVPALRTRPTITDVAKLCGVSPATVSRVLNGKQKFSASEAVREKIVATARKLGYVPDLAARNLNRAQTHIVGLCSPTPRRTWPRASTSRCSRA